MTEIISKIPFFIRQASLLLIAGMLLISIARAQISPGELHRSHSFLEGVDNCSQCHGSSTEQIPAKCLACHTAIALRQAKQKGLHGNPDYKECQLCHVEHQGKDYELIYFKGGEKAFDHSETGFLLEGKHAAADCRKCHRKELLRDKKALEKDKFDLAKTYLGLNRACNSCHFDEHRGQLLSDCSKCHNPSGWKPARGFDHSQSGYPLLGKHAAVPCEKCHPVLTDKTVTHDKSYTKYSAIPHSQCTDCHQDVHKGRLGPVCRNCHTPDGWRTVSTANFDHSRTRYPLEGKHKNTACEKCHKPRQTTTLKFAACLDCHNDYHKGEFAHRASQGACEECHAVAGFTPANFRLSQHDSTDYPLTGAHLAVPCVACHIVTDRATQIRSHRFQFNPIRCLVCHADPHHGAVDRFVSKDGCESCHIEESWAKLSFDHSLTEFALEGKHQATPCVKCHHREKRGSDVHIAFASKKKLCQDCHDDIHRGQFAAADSHGNTDCTRCHTPSNWTAEKFMHNRDSRYQLEGAHQKVPCAKCHIPVMKDDKLFVQYKPLDTTCVSCHGGAELDERKMRL